MALSVEDEDEFNKKYNPIQDFLYVCFDLEKKTNSKETKLIIKITNKNEYNEIVELYNKTKQKQTTHQIVIKFAVEILWDWDH